MTLPKRIAFILMLSALSVFSHRANAQLWKYLNDSPERRKAAKLRVEREASSIVEKRAVVYSDTFSYKEITYTIRSFEGTPYKIKTFYKPFSHVFKLQSLNDNLEILDFSSIDSVHFLNKHLLQIIYSPRGGSNDGSQNTLILSITKGKLNIAMEIESEREFAVPERWGQYYLTIKLTGQNKEDYKLLINTHDKFVSKNKPSKNYDRNNKFTLKFDSIRGVFYNDFKSIDEQFYIWDANDKEKRVKGNFPTIKIGKHECYYIGGVWYERGKNVLTGKNSLIAYCTR